MFDFGCVVWGNTTNANLTRLVKLQKRAARMILKADFMTPSEQLFKELNWLPFSKRVQYHTCLTVYKSISGQAPECISSLLTYVSNHHERQSRSTTLDLLHIPWSLSATFDRAFSVQGPKLRNSVPADIRNSKSIKRFKSELKRYLLYNNWNAWKSCRIRNCSPATVGCGSLGCVWTKARSTLALPVWHCMGTLQGSLEQNYLFVPPSAEVPLDEKSILPIIVKTL